MDLPVIFVTGHADIPMTVRAMKAGAVEFLTKPFREQELLEAVQRAISRHRLTRDHLEMLQGRYELLTPREREVFPWSPAVYSTSKSPPNLMPARRRSKSTAAS